MINNNLISNVIDILINLMDVLIILLPVLLSVAFMTMTLIRGFTDFESLPENKNKVVAIKIEKNKTT